MSYYDDESDTVAGFIKTGFGLISDSLKELFRGKKDDETMGEFLLVKAGLLIMILIGSGLILAMIFWIYIRILSIIS